jgi:acyl dehydratase
MSDTYEAPSEATPGATGTYTRVITDADVALFALITGDQHPLHLDQNYALATSYGRRVVPPTLIGGIIEAALTAILPGTPKMLHCQSLEYPQPLFVESTLTVTIAIMPEPDATARIHCRISATDQDGVVVAIGATTLDVVDLPMLAEEILQPDQE